MKYTEQDLTEVIERVNDLTDNNNLLVNSEYNQRQEIEDIKEILYNVVIALKEAKMLPKDADNTMHDHYIDEAWAEQDNEKK